MTVATFADVAARIGRSLTAQEQAQVTALLVDTEVEIKRLAGLIGREAAWISAPEWEDAIVSVECSVVRRAARIPDALTSVVPGTEGVGFASLPPAQGAVYLRRNERRTLGLPLTGAAVMTPSPLVSQTSLDRFDWGEGWGESCAFDDYAQEW